MSSARFENVTRRFGTLTALEDITLTMEQGELIGLLGPNGAGKSTLISLLTGQRQASSGTVTLFDKSPQDWRNRTRLGVTPQETSLPEALRVGEVIDLVGSHFTDRTSTAQLAEEFAFTDLLKRQTGSLSGGQKRRVAVALAFVGNPKLVLLDEPTTGLDVDARHALWSAIRRQHDAGTTVVVTSHYLEEIEALANRVIVIGEGRVIADDSLDVVIGRVGQRQVRLFGDRATIATLPSAGRIEESAEGELVVYTTNSDALLTELVTAGISFRDLTVRGATLEEAFLTLTGETAA